MNFPWSILVWQRLSATKIRMFAHLYIQALELLERIEKRDLYYLSARTRVAIQCDAGPCIDLKDEQTLLDRIYSYLPCDNTIKKDDLWIEVKY